MLVIIMKSTWSRALFKNCLAYCTENMELAQLKPLKIGKTYSKVDGEVEKFKGLTPTPEFLKKLESLAQVKACFFSFRNLIIL